MHTKSALLIIDMQTEWLQPSAGRFDLEGVLARINQVAQHYRARGDAVVFVRHSNEEASTGSPGWQIDVRLPVLPTDHIVDKCASDSFVQTTLTALLQGLGVGHVTISGMATEFCVDSTVRAALSAGFDVTALSDGHTTGDRPHLSAQAIVTHHNWVWTHLAPPAGRVLRVLTAGEVLES
jgi:nicotinamidase-related amidase